MMKSNLLRGSVLVATILLFAGCGKPDAPPEPMRSVLTQIVGAAAENASATYAGEVRSRYETPLGFRIPGKVAARLVDVGARVGAQPIVMGAYVFCARRDRWRTPALLAFRRWLVKEAAEEAARW